MVMRERGGGRQPHAPLTLPLPIPITTLPILPFLPLHHQPSAPPAAGPTITALSDLDRLSVLGRGSGGTVYKALHRPTSSVLALKVLRLSSSAAREADILRRLDSPHVVRCLAVLSDGTDLCLAMECMPRGSLRDLLSRLRALPEPTIALLASRLLQGLRYLHNLGIVHGDINPSNLLVGDKGEIKIADFGSSRVNNNNNNNNSVNVDDDYYSRGHWGGTCAYMSPERLDGEGFGGGGDGGGFAGDVWGVGVVLLECYMGRFPLVGAGERADWATLMCRVCFGGGGVAEVPGMASAEFRGFVGKCLEKEWRRRGTVGELLAHPFLTSSDSSVDSASCLMLGLDDD